MKKASILVKDKVSRDPRILGSLGFLIAFHFYQDIVNAVFEPGEKKHIYQQDLEGYFIKGARKYQLMMTCIRTCNRIAAEIDMLNNCIVVQVNFVNADKSQTKFIRALYCLDGRLTRSRHSFE